MVGKKKPDLAVLIGMGKPHDDEEGGEEHDADQAKHDAAQAMLDAFHAKDVDALCEALDAYFDLKTSEGGEEEEGDEEGQ